MSWASRIDILACIPMKRRFAVSFAALSICCAAAAAEKPKLVVAIAVDQFRYDYLLRFRAEYKQGLDRLLTRGAVFTKTWSGFGGSVPIQSA